MRTIEDIRDLLKQYDKQCGLSAHMLHIKIVHSVIRLGCYTWSDRYEYFQFSEQLLDPYQYSDEELQNIVGHEFCHYYCRHIYKRRVKSHGTEWQRACQKFGVQPSRFISETTDPDRQRKQRDYIERRAKYRLTCPQCGSISLYFRAGRFIQTMLRNPDELRIKCSQCGTRLKRENLEILR